MTKNSKFSEPLALAVASGDSVASAADRIGVSASHAYRLTHAPGFAERVASIRTAATDSAVGKLSIAAVDAVSVLRAIALDTEAKPSDRVSAAKSILSALAPLSELHELRRRLDKLEANNLRIAR